MRTLIALVALVALVALAGCGATGTQTAMGQMSVSELKQELDANSGLFLLDVRTPAEFSGDGHIAGATLIPVDELEQRLSELPKDAPIACICRSGNRSSSACALLAERGYDATNVTGGMNAWKQAGFPVE